MALNSINTNIAAMAAQGNINKASNMTGSSIARLSSGDRIVQASDDVAAMSAGTSLRTNVTTLRMALINTSQGSSLLQVADGALNQITDILQRQKSIAVQAGSGSLTSAERSFLDQEFQNLTQEIDRLAEQTNFNGVSLLDGALSERVAVEDTTTNADAANISITFSANPANNDIISFVDVQGGNNVNLTFVAAAPANGNEVQIGGTIAETVQNLATTINASTDASIRTLNASAQGNTITLTQAGAGVASEASLLINTGAVSTALDANATISGSTGGGAYIDLFQDPITAANVTDSVIGTTTDAPFDATDVLAMTDGDGNTYDLLDGTLVAATTVGSIAGGTPGLQDIVDTINSFSDQHGFSAQIVGFEANYNIRIYGESLYNDDTVNTAAAVQLDSTGSAAAAAVLLTGLTGAANTVNNTFVGFGGASDVGLGAGDTVATGAIGDSILTSQDQAKSSVSIIFPDISDSDLLPDLTTGVAGAAANITITSLGDPAAPAATDITTVFTFSGNDVDVAAPTEISVGATLEETLDNAVAAINSYVGNSAEQFSFQQFEARRDGNQIVIETIDVGRAGQTDGVRAVNIATNATAAQSISVTNGGNLNNGSNTGGVNTSDVTNTAFVGTVSGFSATFDGTADAVDVEIAVGEFTYSATITDTTPSANTVVRFESQDGGGAFDVELASGQGVSVNSQADAETLAQRLDAAFASLNFSQSRNVASFDSSAPIVTNGTVTGSLIGSRMDLQLDNFDDVQVQSIRVDAPSGSQENASVSFTINGEEYVSQNPLSDQLGANQTYDFVSRDNADNVLSFTTGGTAISLSTDAEAASFEDALTQAFGVSEESAAVNFQVGITTSDTLQISVDTVTTREIFDGQNLNVLTAESAALAADALDAAIDAVTAVRAEVGALQSRFNFASANVESSIANQDAARGVLLDTDIAAESTSFATSQVQLQAGISVLAQANLLPQNLLKLIG